MSQVRILQSKSPMAQFFSISVAHESSTSSFVHEVPSSELFTRLLKLLSDFQRIFLVPRGLPSSRPFDHCIPLLPGTKPVNVQPYRYPHFQKT